MLHLMGIPGFIPQFVLSNFFMWQSLALTSTFLVWNFKQNRKDYLKYGVKLSKVS